MRRRLWISSFEWSTSYQSYLHVVDIHIDHNVIMIDSIVSFSILRAICCVRMYFFSVLFIPSLYHVGCSICTLVVNHHSCSNTWTIYIVMCCIIIISCCYLCYFMTHLFIKSICMCIHIIHLWSLSSSITHSHAQFRFRVEISRRRGECNDAINDMPIIETQTAIQYYYISIAMCSYFSCTLVIFSLTYIIQCWSFIRWLVFALFARRCPPFLPSLIVPSVILYTWLVYYLSVLSPLLALP
jgi:hypothetical protein